MEMIWLAAKIAYGVFALMTLAACICWRTYEELEYAANIHQSVEIDADAATYALMGYVCMGALWPVTWFVGGCVGATYLVRKLLKKPQPSQVL